MQVRKFLENNANSGKGLTEARVLWEEVKETEWSVDRNMMKLQFEISFAEEIINDYKTMKGIH